MNENSTATINPARERVARGPDIPLADAMICWNPAYSTGDATKRGACRVVRHPDYAGRSDAYDCTDGACETHWRERSKHLRLAFLFQIFNSMVVGDGIDPQVAHAAFLVIPEYRAFIPSDQQGAEPGAA